MVGPAHRDQDLHGGAWSAGRIADRPSFREMIEKGSRPNTPFEVVPSWGRSQPIFEKLDLPNRAGLRNGRAKKGVDVRYPTGHNQTLH